MISPGYIGWLAMYLLTGHVDADKIAAHADTVSQQSGYYIPHEVAWALAMKESGSGIRGNRVLGVYTDSLRTCRAVGRFQLLTCQKYTLLDPRCTHRAIRYDLDTNIHCGLLWYTIKLRNCNGDHACAIGRYNGRGREADLYARDALAYIGIVHLRLLQSHVRAN